MDVKNECRTLSDTEILGKKLQKCLINWKSMRVSIFIRIESRDRKQIVPYQLTERIDAS